jgi:inner membrane protein
MAAARAPSRPQTTLQLSAAMVFWSLLSLLPDADVIGFRLGIRYSATWGHRGATHSFAFCLGIAVLAAGGAAVLRAPPWRTFIVAACVLVSHPLLDTLTDGGLGCALFWPLSERRYFAPWRPIPVAPIGRIFFSRAGLSVALAELVLFAPVFAFALWPRRRAAGDFHGNR